jgi:3-isopropylmalate/(R)-2-methylmalate dehydratase large subunit
VRRPGSDDRDHRPQHADHAARIADRGQDRGHAGGEADPELPDFGIHCYPLGSDKQGIVHVIGPELGLTQPGMTVVCGDSHTATHGALGALAFGIGTSEVEHVLATQCLLLKRSKTYQGARGWRAEAGVSAKDIILALIARIGIGGGTGSHFRILRIGHPVAVHGRAHDGLQHVDRRRRARGIGRAGRHDVSICSGRQYAPKGAAWDASVARWRQLPTDDGATYDKSITIDAARWSR